MVDDHYAVINSNKEKTHPSLKKKQEKKYDLLFK